MLLHTSIASSNLTTDEMAFKKDVLQLHHC